MWDYLIKKAKIVDVKHEEGEEEEERPIEQTPTNSPQKWPELVLVS